MGLIHKARNLGYSTLSPQPQATWSSEIADPGRHLLIDDVTMFYNFRSDEHIECMVLSVLFVIKLLKCVLE